MSGLHVFYLYVVLFPFKTSMLKPHRSLIHSMIMKKMELAKEVIKYDAPQVEIIEVEVEKGFATSGNLENPGEGSEV